MRIIQIVSSVVYGDGVSNCILSMAKIFDKLHYNNIVLAKNIDVRVTDSRIRKFIDLEKVDFNEDDIILYHFYDGVELNYEVEKLTNKKILIFHNVTPPEFFHGISYFSFQRCMIGKYDVRHTAGHYLKAVALSEFSKADLTEAGWNAEDVCVLPIIELNEIQTKPDQKTLAKYRDGRVNILFTGRIAPNKKIEDVIKMYAYYHQNVNAESRLILVGNIIYENYYKALLDYIQENSIDNVIFTNHVSNEELEAYYAAADIFLCMSEHEGFCIPLLEAMRRDVPVIAYNAAAVPDTLQDTGILIDEKDGRTVSDAIVKILTDGSFREELLAGQRERVRKFNIDYYRGDLQRLIETVRDIGSYAYPAENSELRIGKERKTRSVDYMKKVIEELEDYGQIVIYGIGMIGKQFVTDLKDCGFERIDAICDNAFPEKEYMGLPVYKLEDCVSKYRDAIYVITVQKQFVSIASDLLKRGIPKDSIICYDNARKMLTH